MNAVSRHWEIVRGALADERERKRSVFRSDEAAFLPAALEIIETPVSPTGRITTWVLLGLLVFVISWLALGKIDVVASATGRLIPADSVKLIQPAEPGVVHAILVREGQYVRAGQALVELDPTISTAEAAQARKALETALLDAARGRAILSGLDGHGFAFVPPAGTPSQVVATQFALARAQLENIRASAITHRAERDAAMSTLGEARVQAIKLTETLPLLDEQIKANELLLAKGYVSKLKVIEMRRQRLAVARDRDIAIQTANKAAAQMAGARGSVVQSEAEARARVLVDLVKAEADAKLRLEELSKATKRSSLQTLVSPVDGTVSQLAIHTLGGVVEATKPVMVIVPKGGRLVADVKILNRDVGFIEVGQSVAVKLEAFPFTRYGTLQGRIESLGSDAIEDEALGLVYPARISLDSPRSPVRHAKIKPNVGMRVTVDVRTGRRSILSYLISPIDQTAQEAGRER
ncbi:HlyD family type I secretion periplasmic adaptor subunit [Sphingomonas suaedae]|uniref:Membrane fusion protein (MFP) family protein n=1 Tax=Sphingomonas suaedae TaxID=2599297 RepID=A0A518RC83_9SPHN|nr:HlyD family type I secretion periplasmic adaptor subunit [Sphingomonas suaedae]QDX25063.1 HlyD family type I secretion periplasmic adaptor subunit [Sphingomonas suaedae]